jgi:large subunit ribosomal protein L30e
MTVEEMLKAAINDERAIFGAKESVKYAEDLEAVVVAANTPEDIRSPVEEAADEAGVAVEVFNGTNKELGSLCGKPFAVSTIGVREADSEGL